MYCCKSFSAPNILIPKLSSRTNSVNNFSILDFAQDDRAYGSAEDLAELPDIGLSSDSTTAASDLSSVVTSSSGSLVASKIMRVAKQLENLKMNHGSKGVHNGPHNSCPQEKVEDVEVKDGNGDTGLPQPSLIKNPGAVVAKILQDAKARRLATVAGAPSKDAGIPDYVAL